MKYYLWIVAASVAAAPQLGSAEVDYTRLELAHTLKGHEATVRAITVSPDSNTLASAGSDKTIRLWDISSGKLKAVLRGHSQTVRALRFSPDGALLASGAYGGDKEIVRLWDVARGEQLAPLTAAKTSTRFLAFSPDGKTLAWDDRTAIRLCHIPTRKEAAPLSTAGVVREIVFSPDGRTLATCFFHGDGFQAWSIDGRKIFTVDGDFTTIRFTSDGKTLTAGAFRRIVKWDVSEGRELALVKGGRSHAPPFPQSQLSPDGGTLATVDKDLAVVNFRGDAAPFGKQRCQLILMDTTSGKERTLYETRGTANWFRRVLHSPDGGTVALESRLRDAWTLVDVATGEQRAKLTAPDTGRRGGGYPRVTFAPNGGAIAFSRGPIVQLWLTP